MAFLKSNGNPGDTVETYPYSKAQWRQDFPNVSLPNTEEGAKDFGVHRVAETAKPDPSDPAEFKVVEDTPTLVGVTWTQVWTEIELTAEEKANQSHNSDLNSIYTDLKASQWHREFSRMTIPELDAYIAANVNTNAEVKDYLINVSYLCLMLAQERRSSVDPT